MSRLRVGIIGCGVVGAAIAYELSQVPELEVIALDRRSPGPWEATGAALGVLMAAISQKRRGRALQLRLSSLKRYETLIPELEAITGQPIPYNRQGILRLCFDPEELARWQTVQEIRREQGFSLEILNAPSVLAAYPELGTARSFTTQQPLVGAVYSPGDRQVHPVQLTQSLLQAAVHQGARVQWQTPVRGFKTLAASQGTWVKQLQTPTASIPIDWLVIAGGLGSTPLTTVLAAQVDIRPVLGQALHLRCQHCFSYPRPVISGEDVHLVSLNSQELWVGATVEFPPESSNREIQPDPSQLQALWQQAIGLCPALEQSTVLNSWMGLRPRPYNQPAPLIGPLAGYQNVLLATGHYRNGILLAPITALQIRELIAQQL